MRWLTAVAIAATATYALRVASTRLGGGGLPPVAHRALRLSAVALLAAVGVASLPHAAGGSFSLAAATALAVSVVVARRRSSATIVMGIGAAVYGVMVPLVG